MGVLNLTPNSFSDGGKYNKKGIGILHAKRLIKDGCGILDIGGEATNPGSKEVDVDIEYKTLRTNMSLLDSQYRYQRFKVNKHQNRH